MLWKELSNLTNLFVDFELFHMIFLSNVIHFLQASTKLVQVGFFHQVESVDEGSLTGGAVRSRADALSILRDTHQV